ncbi:hypothetical protein A1O7_01477 [Cladophialophora yegresii CBS 114405]|uniref:Eisosome protein 1 n=1 Tax=Cladophialophora yegresii CBS 114405 TaxID=1182544 RepID=W9WAJ0_9EURO|nr:uncharacterized protein A1O7_01477 [Cladophialophora yegresii CBS 114405]EXJ65137.1 hypothetical protein A1O7_01477 [Cladophialophora yegresii CBS 114405]
MDRLLIANTGAAQSLKYARAQDLPSFPSSGGVKLASAGAAASLADSNKKAFEHWTPGELPHANTAAEKARDYKMEPLWEPELSRAGSQAAIAAHRDAGSVDIWTAPETEHGHSAASSALQNPKSPPAITERHVSGDDRQKALLAATASVKGGRRRAGSAPVHPVPSNGPSAWALKAATQSHNSKPLNGPTPQSSKSEMSSTDAARIQNMAKNNVSRQMYTSNPPVAIEVEERRRQDMLRASAVAMAKKMFAIQQEQIDEARGIHRSQSHYAAHTARRRAQSDAANQPARTGEVPRYENLEEQARKLAQDRLAKLHDEHAEYRQYYGQNTTPQRSRTFLRRGRRRSDIPENDDDSDLEESRKIRQQMSLFQGKLAEVDSKKRQADRDALLAAAHKNVTARMNAMDEKVFSETGKTSPHQRELWERQARERAQRDSDERLMNVGKVHIGGGKYLEQEEIEAIAKARLQPTLDEISQKAEEQRARDEELRLEQERLKAEQETERKRQAEIKAEQKAALGKSTRGAGVQVSLTTIDREKAEQRAQRMEEKRILEEQKHEERRVRTEQKSTEKKAREEANQADKERRRAEKAEKGHPESGKPRFLPSFLGRGGVAGGTAAGAGGAAAGEGAVAVAEGGARPVTAGSEGPAVAALEPDELAGETFHDKVTLDTGEAIHGQVTMDPGEAAHAVAAADAEDEVKPVAAPVVSQEDEKPKDNIGARPYSSSGPPQESTSPVSQTSPASPSKRNSRVKSFFKRFRSGSKAEDDFSRDQAATTETAPNEPLSSRPQTAEPIKEEEPAATDSIRDVAFAGRSDNETEDMYGGSAEPYGRVSPVQDDPAPGVATSTSGPGPGVEEGGAKERDISPPSDTSSLSEEPYVIAADVASSRYSTEHGTGSKRNSGYDQVATLTDEEEEPRGRKGFRERFLKKVIPGRDKDKRQPGAFTSSAVGSSAAAQTGAASASSARATGPEPQTTDPVSGSGVSQAHPEEEPQDKVQEPSATSTEATGHSTVTGTTTPALTHAQTNGDDDEDFEEARDTFDEGRLVSASKVDSGSARIVDVNSPMTSTGAKGRPSGEGSRFTEEL